MSFTVNKVTTSNASPFSIYQAVLNDPAITATFAIDKVRKDGGNLEFVFIGAGPLPAPDLAALDALIVRLDGATEPLEQSFFISDKRVGHIGSITNGQILEWNTAGSKFIPATPAAGGSTTLAGLTDTDVSGIVDGSNLIYNTTSGKWENKNFATAPTVGTGANDDYPTVYDAHSAGETSIRIVTDITETQTVAGAGGTPIHIIEDMDINIAVGVVWTLGNGSSEVFIGKSVNVLGDSLTSQIKVEPIHGAFQNFVVASTAETKTKLSNIEIFSNNSVAGSVLAMNTEIVFDAVRITGTGTARMRINGTITNSLIDGDFVQMQGTRAGLINNSLSNTIEIRGDVKEFLILGNYMDDSGIIEFINTGGTLENGVISGNGFNTVTINQNMVNVLFGNNRIKVLQMGVTDGASVSRCMFAGNQFPANISITSGSNTVSFQNSHFVGNMFDGTFSLIKGTATPSLLSTSWESNLFRQTVVLNDCNCEDIDFKDNRFNSTLITTAGTWLDGRIAGNRFNGGTFSSTFTNMIIQNNQFELPAQFNDMTDCMVDGNDFNNTFVIAGGFTALRTVIKNNTFRFGVSSSATFTNCVVTNNNYKGNPPNYGRRLANDTSTDSLYRFYVKAIPTSDEDLDDDVYQDPQSMPKNKLAIGTFTGNAFSERDQDFLLVWALTMNGKEDEEQYIEYRIFCDTTENQGEITPVSPLFLPLAGDTRILNKRVDLSTIRRLHTIYGQQIINIPKITSGDLLIGAQHRELDGGASHIEHIELWLTPLDTTISPLVVPFP